MSSLLRLSQHDVWKQASGLSMGVQSACQWALVSLCSSVFSSFLLTLMMMSVLHEHVGHLVAFVIEICRCQP